MTLGWNVRFKADSGYNLVEKQARCIKFWQGQVNETAT
jgi:hypothetical protein